MRDCSFPRAGRSHGRDGDRCGRRHRRRRRVRDRVTRDPAGNDGQRLGDLFRRGNLRLARGSVRPTGLGAAKRRLPAARGRHAQVRPETATGTARRFLEPKRLANRSYFPAFFFDFFLPLAVFLAAFFFAAFLLTFFLVFRLATLVILFPAKATNPLYQNQAFKGAPNQPLACVFTGFFMVFL